MAAGLMATTLVIGARAEAVVTLPVDIQDFVGHKKADVRKAKEIAGAIFDAAGIEIVWVETPAGTARLHGQISVVLPPASLTRRIARHADALGSTRVRTEQLYAVYVYCDRVDEAAKQAGQSANVVLGAVIAHELGHLLMPGRPHTATGVMHAVLGAKELGIAAQGELRFDADQACDLRAAVGARLNDQQASR
jgi:hypothetical protein